MDQVVSDGFGDCVFQKARDKIYVILTQCGRKSALRKVVSDCSLHLDRDSLDEEGRKAVHLACDNNNIHHLRVLFNKDCTVNVLDYKHRTPLHYALSNKDVNMKVLRLLLDRGADTNAVDRNGDTPLHVAVRNLSDVEGYTYIIVNLLLKYGANVFLANSFGELPLSIAYAHNNKGLVLVQQLLGLTADLFLSAIQNNLPMANIFKNPESRFVLLNSIYSLAIKNGLYKALPKTCKKTDLVEFHSLFHILSKLHFEMAGDMLNRVVMVELMSRTFYPRSSLVSHNTDKAIHGKFCSKHEVCLARRFPQRLILKCSSDSDDPLELQQRWRSLREFIQIAESDVVGNSILHFAAKTKNWSMLLLLLELGGLDPNTRNCSGTTPLQMALVGYLEDGDEDEDDLDAISLLLHYGADPHLRDELGQNSYQLAAVSDSSSVITLLFAHAPLKSLDVYHVMLTTALHLNNTEAFKAILDDRYFVRMTRAPEKGLRCTVCDCDITKSHYKAMIHANLVELAIQSGSYRNVLDLLPHLSERVLRHFTKTCQSPTGNTLLHLCCWFGIRHDVFLSILNLCDENINMIRNIDGNTPLHFACYGSVKQERQKPVEKAPYRKLGRPRQNVGKSSEGESVLSLHQMRDERYQRKMTPKPNFNITDKVQIVQHLCSLGADVESRNRRGETPLYVACKSGFLPIVQYLHFEKSACLNIKPFDGVGLLELALVGRDQSLVEFLLRYGDAEKLISMVSNVSLTNCRKDTLLHIICECTSKNSGEWINVLLQNGARVDLENCSNETPLHTVIRTYNASSLNMLLAALKGCQYEKSDTDKLLQKALSYAVEIEAPILAIKQLLDRGVDPNFVCGRFERNRRGYNMPQTLIGRACSRSNAKILTLLLMHGAKLVHHQVDQCIQSLSFNVEHCDEKLKMIYNFITFGCDVRKFALDWCLERIPQRDMKRKVFEMFLSAGVTTAYKLTMYSRLNLENNLPDDDTELTSRFLLACGYISPLIGSDSPRVPRLHSLCCRAVRDRLLPNAWCRTDALPLPSQLKDQVTLNHKVYFREYQVTFSESELCYHCN